MSANESKPLNVVCFATFFKGGDFMRTCKAEGCNVTLVTKEKMLYEDWPREALDEVFALPNDAPVELFLDLISHIGKTRKPDRIVALEEFDVVIAALAREHLCLPGMSSSAAKTFRDKYAMAVNARNAGLTVPEFVVAINNYRQSGGGNFPHVKTAPVVYNRQVEIRQLIIDWVTARTTIDPGTFASVDWRLVANGQRVTIS